VKRGDLVIKVRGYSDKNKVGVVIEDLMVNPTGNEFIDVMVDGVKTTWYADYVEVINECKWL
jgi:hypothetical protein